MDDVPELWVNCPECRGRGYRRSTSVATLRPMTDPCGFCKGKKKVDPDRLHVTRGEVKKLIDAAVVEAVAKTLLILKEREEHGEE